MAFFRHLTQQNETYCAHLLAALGLAARAGMAAVCLVGHGLLPSLATTAGGDILLQCAETVRARRASARLHTPEKNRQHEQ